MGANYKWNNVYSAPCAVYVAQLGAGRQPGNQATRQPGDLATWEWEKRKPERVTRTGSGTGTGAERQAALGALRQWEDDVTRQFSA